MSTLNDVKQFHLTFGHPVVETPAIPSEDRCKLRVELLAEELKELQAAIDENDIVGVADALCDIQYVLNGAVLEFGLADKFPALMGEVHYSNMSKAHSTPEEAKKTVKASAKDGVECVVSEVNGKFIVTRVSDNKVIKNIKYIPADLKSIVNAK